MSRRRCAVVHRRSQRCKIMVQDVQTGLYWFADRDSKRSAPGSVSAKATARMARSGSDLKLTHERRQWWWLGKLVLVCCTVFDQ
ncbi:hypothetical protein BRADI_1g29642v3 [Brachypodium distachyon]|uniref:Uncharacterized protein n=1 Tax=Brachypodium distachyon TaxID=15368 RepID=A0A0Q3RUH1_BRADI|nr:hypothetical protein BRADI_1g29642v3 [Brachypodium distachyon]